MITTPEQVIARRLLGLIVAKFGPFRISQLDLDATILHAARNTIRLTEDLATKEVVISAK